jgi:deoxyribodipyrimidine photo-lyase
LLDNDVCSNWGNWNYTAGIGNDAREFRYFNITKQSRDYDPQGEYLRYWLPELARLPGDKIHDPSALSQQEQKEFCLKVGEDYPRPIVDFLESINVNKIIYQTALNLASR